MGKFRIRKKHNSLLLILLHSAHVKEKKRHVPIEKYEEEAGN
jgi:hypothetical protein